MMERHGNRRSLQDVLFFLIVHQNAIHHLLDPCQISSRKPKCLQRMSIKDFPEPVDRNGNHQRGVMFIQNRLQGTVQKDMVHPIIDSGESMGYCMEYVVLGLQTVHDDHVIKISCREIGTL